MRGLLIEESQIEDFLSINGHQQRDLTKIIIPIFLHNIKSFPTKFIKTKENKTYN